MGNIFASTISHQLQSLRPAEKTRFTAKIIGVR